MAIQILLREHNYFRYTFQSIVNTFQRNDRVDSSKIKKLLHILDCHETMEQKIWYPALLHATSLKNKQLHRRYKHVVGHLLKEEKEAANLLPKVKHALKRVKNSTNSQDIFDFWTLFARLYKDVLHHAHEEETKLFPMAQRDFTRQELQIIGLLMRKY